MFVQTTEYLINAIFNNSLNIRHLCGTKCTKTRLIGMCWNYLLRNQQ